MGRKTQVSLKKKCAPPNLCASSFEETNGTTEKSCSLFYHFCLVNKYSRNADIKLLKMGLLSKNILCL